MAQDSSQPRAHILVVDDEADIRELVVRAFADEADLQFTTLADATSAINWLGEHQADLLLADLFLPDMNGLELISRARARYPQMLAIATSAHPSVSRIIEAMRLGVCDFLGKPFDPATLVSAIASVVRPGAD